MSFEAPFHVQVTMSYSFIDLGLITWPNLCHFFSVLRMFYRFCLRLLVLTSLMIFFLKVTDIFFWKNYFFIHHFKVCKYIFYALNTAIIINITSRFLMKCQYTGKQSMWR